jgi:uncharacterized protein YhaN
VKVIRLDLIAFGPFTNACLNFEHSGNPIHIVYGHNEAGKSSCLRALRYWLFGIPHQTSDNFVHPYGNLRIGGVLEDNQGNRLQMIRRKATASTLREADDVKPIEPNQLQEFLGTVNASTFEKRFGIDHQELVRGGVELASGGGELGEILFSAGSGITELPKIQDDLEHEMRSLFAAKRPSASINAAVRKLNEARAKIKNLSLSSNHWQQHQQTLETAIHRRGEIEQYLRTHRAELNRLNRILKGIPLFSQLRAENSKQSKLDGARILPQDFTERRSRAITLRAAALQNRQDAELETQQLQKLIAGIILPSQVLEHRATIHSLHTELGSYQKAAKDRPRLLAEIRLKEDSLKKSLRDLGWEENISQLEPFQLSQVQRVRLRELSTQHHKLEAQQNELEKLRRRLSQSIRDHESKPDEEVAVFDLTPLKMAIQRTLSLGNIEKQRSEAQFEISHLVERATSELNLLPIAPWNLDQLPHLSVPMMETIERFHKKLYDIDEQIKSHTEKLSELVTRFQQVTHSLNQLTLERDVPTEEDLRQARVQRDRGWNIVLNVWRGDLSESDMEVVNYCSEHDDADDLPSAFQAAMKLADSIADRLRREATRVSDKIKLAAESEDLNQRIECERASLGQRQEERKQVVLDWQQQWKPAGLDPLPPHEMAAWRRKIDELKNQAVSIHQLKRKISDFDASIANAIEELRQSLCGSALNYSASADSLGQWLVFCQDTLRCLEEAHQTRRDRANQLRKLHDDLRANSEELAESKRQMQQWNAEWSDAIAALSLPGSPNCSEVHLLLQTLDQLLATHQGIDELKRRVVGIDREAKHFSQMVQQVASQVAPDLDLPADQTVIELQRRLDDANRAQTRLDQWQERLCVEQSKLENANLDYERWTEQLQILCDQAGCSDADQLPMAEQRSLERQQCEQKIQQLESDLDQLAAPESANEFMKVIEVSNGDSLAAEIQQLEETIHRMEREIGEVSQVIGSEQTTLSQMDGSALAAQAQEEVEELLAEIRCDAQQYIRLWLAWKVLNDSVERFRQSSQGPILSRAGQLFSQLTLGSFCKLRADYDEKGQAILVGVRANGNMSVGVDGMSDGTRDQLYLALRLALLESHLQDHAPVPLIVDDILIQFDDERSAAALQILNKLSEQTQVIFFTHHHRLVDIAEKNLPQDNVVVHRL